MNTCSISFSCVSIKGEFNQREQQCHPSSAAPIICGRQRPASPQGTCGDETNLTGKAKDWKVCRTKLMLVNNVALVFFFVFLLINDRIARNGTWTMLTRRFLPFKPFLNVRTVLTMHVYIPICQGSKAASIAWWTCIHVIISSDVAPCFEIPLFSLFKCLVLYWKRPYLFLVFWVFLHPVLISAPFTSCVSQSWVIVIMEVRWKTLTPSFSHVLSPSYWKLKAVFHLWSAPWGVILTIIFSLLLFSMPLSPSAHPLHALVNVWVFFYSLRSRCSCGDS